MGNIVKTNTDEAVTDEGGSTSFTFAVSYYVNVLLLNLSEPDFHTKLQVSY